MKVSGLELVYQGAEAKVYSFSMMDRPCIVKERFVKRYRHSAMDVNIRSQRNKAEAKALLKAGQLGMSVRFFLAYNNSKYR